MYISRLALDHYRSWEHCVLDFKPGINILQGANGLGKTNIVEAIEVLSTGSSHRACKVVIGQQGKEFWGITGLDTKTGETQWYNYNDCVSLENWAVLDRLLKTRFGWMELTDPALVIETKMLAKAQLGN